VYTPLCKGSQLEKDSVTRLYREQGLQLQTALRGEQSGVYHLQQLLGAQKLKAFNSLTDFLSGYRTGDESALLIQCCFVLLASGGGCMRAKPIPVRFPYGFQTVHRGERDWMA